MPSLADLTVRVGGDFSALRDASNKMLDEVKKVAGELSTNYAATALAVAKYGTALASSGGAAENAANAYRALRLVLAPTAFTAASIAIGVLVEETIRLTNARAKLIEQQSLYAATVNVPINRVSALDSVAQIAGGSSSGIRSLSASSGLNASELGKVAAAWAAMEDPVQRAAAAVKLFGAANAGLALRELTPEFADAAAATDKFGSTLGEVSRNQIYTFRQDLLALKRTFTEFPPALKVLAEETKTRMEEMGAGAWAGIKEVARALDDMVAKATRLRGALAPVQKLTDADLHKGDRVSDSARNGMVADDLFAQSKGAWDRYYQTLEGKKTALEAAVKRSEEAYKTLADDAAKRQANPNDPSLMTGQQRFNTAQQLDPTADARLAAIKEQIEKEKNAERDAKEAHRKATEDARQGDELALAQLKSHHEMSYGQIIRYWQQRLAAESSNADRSRDIQITLGNLYQEQDKAFGRIAQHSIQTFKTEGVDAEKVKSFVSAMAAEADEIIQKLTDDIVRTNARLAELSARGAGDSKAAENEMKRLVAQRTYGLELSHTLQQEVAFMRTMNAMDDKAAQDHIDELKSEMEIAAAAGDTVKAKERENEISRAQADATLRRVAGETAVLEKIKQQTLAQKLTNDVKGLSGSLGGALAGGIMGGGHGGIGQEIERSLKNFGQQVLGQTFKAAIDKLVVQTGLNTAAMHIGHSIMSGHAATMIGHAAVMVWHGAITAALTIATWVQIAWTQILAAVEAVKAFFGFADGGIPPVGVPSLVGERGPELFIPSQLGTVIPHSKTMALLSGGGSGIPGASGGNTNHFYINSPNPRDITRQISSFMKSAGGPKFAAASR